METAPALVVSGRERFALGVFAVFTALIAANALQSAILGAVLGRDFPVGRSIGASALTWYAWAALTPVIAILVRRFPFTRGRWKRSVLVHLAASMAIFGAQFALFSLGSRALHLEPARSARRLAIGPPAPPRGPVEEAFRWYFFRGAGTYALIVGGLVLLEYVRKDRERVALEGQLALAELKALRMQLQPHFLFNTLHAIGVLIHSDPKAAHVMLTRLA